MITLLFIVRIPNVAKTAKPVNRQRLAEAIAKVESSGPCLNRQNLYTLAAEQYNIACGATCPKDWITPSIVLLRIQEWQMTVKTPIGKRGRPAGTKLAPKLDANGNAVPRKKRTGRKASAENLNAMRAGEFANPSFDGLLNKIASGSLTARIKANCLACAGFVREEIKHCQCVSCPLWDVRPYRHDSLDSPSAHDTNETLDAQPALAYALPIVTL